MDANSELLFQKYNDLIFELVDVLNDADKTGHVVVEYDGKYKFQGFDSDSFAEKLNSAGWNYIERKPFREFIFNKALKLSNIKIIEVHND